MANRKNEAGTRERLLVLKKIVEREELELAKQGVKIKLRMTK